MNFLLNDNNAQQFNIQNPNTKLSSQIFILILHNLIARYLESNSVMFVQYYVHFID